MRTMSICVSDIPKEKLVTGKNGKIYLNLTSYDNDEVDKFGNDFPLFISQSKEEREAKIKRIYLGNGKIQGKVQSPDTITLPSGRTVGLVDAPDNGLVDDLPF